MTTSIDTHIALELEKMRSELKSYADSRSERARNTAIGVLAFVALILTIGGALGINSIVGAALKDSGVAAAIEEATNAKDQALELSNQTGAALSEAEAALSEIEQRLGALSSVLSQIDAIQGTVQAQGDKVGDLERKLQNTSTTASNATSSAAWRRANSEIEELISNLENKVRELSQVVSLEKAAGHMTFVPQGTPCPKGWRTNGSIGWIMENRIYNKGHVGKGGGYNADWSWTHPVLCTR